MPKSNPDVAAAVQRFWETRQGQRAASPTPGLVDSNRSAVTGGKHLDGFAELLRARLRAAGVADQHIMDRGRDAITLPGYFRPAKQWDVVVVRDGCLLAAIELKSLCGPSFGNNYNNRMEEAVGCSHDFWIAFRRGMFGSSPPPFLGYFLLLEDAPQSSKDVDVIEHHFQAADDFDDVSYASRCAESLKRLDDEQLYSATCLILSAREAGLRGQYSQPTDQASFERFALVMQTMVKAHA